MPDIKTDNINLLRNGIKSQSEWDMILILHKFLYLKGLISKLTLRGKLHFYIKAEKTSLFGEILA